MSTIRKCLLCQVELNKQSLMQYLMNDSLCAVCRASLRIRKRTIQMKKLKVTSFGLYENELADALIQYKECMDEALKDMFLFDVKDWIRFHYHNCVFLCAPSSQKNLERRGFQHVISMFEQCGIEILDCFEKIGDVSQKEASLKERTEISDVLVLKKDVQLPEKRLVLIDDTVTTGNTLFALQKLLGEKRCSEALCLCIHPKLLTEYDKKFRKKRIY